MCTHWNDLLKGADSGFSKPQVQIDVNGYHTRGMTKWPLSLPFPPVNDETAVMIPIILLGSSIALK